MNRNVEVNVTGIHSREGLPLQRRILCEFLREQGMDDWEKQDEGLEGCM